MYLIQVRTNSLYNNYLFTNLLINTKVDRCNSQNANSTENTIHLFIQCKTRLFSHCTSSQRPERFENALDIVLTVAKALTVVVNPEAEMRSPPATRQLTSVAAVYDFTISTMLCWSLTRTSSILF